jgi:RTX calcium-binding nonapeptide repeat (4 copies)
VIWCAVLLLVVGCSGVRSQAPQEKQGHTEATRMEQGNSPQATGSEEARCEGTRTIKVRPMPRSDVWDLTKKVDFTTYDLRGCPRGGLFSGTAKKDKLAGRDSDDEIRGLGADDDLIGGLGDDVIYGGPGGDRLADWPLAGGGGGGGPPSMERILREESAKAGGDDVLNGGGGNDELASDKGADVLFGGDGNDYLFDEVNERERDKLYCGKGEDVYGADKNDYVDSSCEHTLDEVYAEGPN